MSFGVRILPEPIRIIDAASFSGGFQAIGSPLAHVSCLIKFVNDSDAGVFISWDGINLHDFIPAGSFALYDITSNTQRENGLYIGKGTQFYVMASAGTGNLYITTLYPNEGP